MRIGQSQAVFVDPFDVASVHKVAHDLGLSNDAIVGCIATHKHFDHAGGNEAFAKTFPGRPIWGGSEDVSKVSHIVKHGDKFTLFDHAPVHVTAYATPCHTRESTCFFVEDERSEEVLASTGHGFKEGPEGEKKRGVFTGYVILTLTVSDTLFIAGCGRFFEGDAHDMHHALNEVLAALPSDTIVYCGHGMYYTLT
ncbi:hydroxyacylglutathione hydrolase [Malassezia nana]|uniref:hydroxyacylglutathione hydrolase n=1 Tax=Malassezia nana TaxID=180528 RepID=A0AAF0J4M1_9BASI|nr:hydroxyacylglutathione hydrolase [Malassezia nana]